MHHFNYVIKEWDGTLRNVAIHWRPRISTVTYKDGVQHKVATAYAESLVYHKIDSNWGGDIEWGELP